MEDSCRITVDAVPNSSELCSINKITSRTFSEIYGSILDRFTLDDYRSMLFLLIDYKIELDDFLYLAKKEKIYLKNKILEMNLDESFFIECLGTMKMNRELKYFGTCCHIFESKKQEFDEINEIWKILYTLCEEVSDEYLQIMKKTLPASDILSAEEWFCYAIKRKIISTTDISKLKQIFPNNPVCLNIINNFAGPKIPYYKMRTPTANSPCGIALIFNFEHFDKSHLKERKGSQVDVDSLVELWKLFGFITHIFKDLNSSDALTEIKKISIQDYSSYDAFVCCILSHGAPNVIYASDGKTIPIYELVTVVSSSKSLNGKPKLFFIQACQGSNKIVTDGCTKVQQPCTQVDSTIYPMGLDVYVAVATLNGFVSFRSPTKGTFFIQALCEAMKKYTHNRQNSLMNIMAQVTQDVAEKKIPFENGEEAIQIVPLVTTLRKLLFFKRTY